jgi:hypothetical protein
MRSEVNFTSLDRMSYEELYLEFFPDHKNNQKHNKPILEENACPEFWIDEGEVYGDEYDLPSARMMQGAR